MPFSVYISKLVSLSGTFFFFFLMVGRLMCLLIFWFSSCCRILNFSPCFFSPFHFSLSFWLFFFFIYIACGLSYFLNLWFDLIIGLENFHALSLQILHFHHFLSVHTWTPIYIFIGFPPFYSIMSSILFYIFTSLYVSQVVSFGSVFQLTN